MLGVWGRTRGSRDKERKKLERRDRTYRGKNTCEGGLGGKNGKGLKNEGTGYGERETQGSLDKDEKKEIEPNSKYRPLSNDSSARLG